MTTINVVVTDQDLVITQKPLLASGNKETVLLRAEFSEEWDGLSKTAVFYQNERNAYYVLLNYSDECEIPWEAIASEGTMYFGFFGTKGEYRKTSEVIAYRIKKGAWSETLAPSDPTTDIYSKIIDDYAATYSKAEECAESAEASSQAAQNSANDVADILSILRLSASIVCDKVFTLTVDGWDTRTKMQVVNIDTVNPNSSIIIAPQHNGMIAPYKRAGIDITITRPKQINFHYTRKPTEDIYLRATIINSGGANGVPADKMVFTDQNTGTNYKVYVSDGKLTMDAVESEG